MSTALDKLIFPRYSLSMKQTAMQKAIKRAADRAGGQSALGRLIGVSRAQVWAWIHRDGKCWPHKAIAIEAATGVSRHELRPDVFGPKGGK